MFIKGETAKPVIHPVMEIDGLDEFELDYINQGLSDTGRSNENGSEIVRRTSDRRKTRFSVKDNSPANQERYSVMQ